MNIFVNILVAFICLAIGYLMGSANISIPLGKLKFKQDPRDYGSHNVGATNCGRLWGKKYFFVVFWFDVFKTVAPLYICWAILTFVPFNNGSPLLPHAADMYAGKVDGYIIQWPIYWMAALGSMLGGIFPLFLKFKGGKAASSMVGITITTSWALGVLGAISYFSFLFKYKYVSLASIMTSIINAILTWIWAILIMCKVFPEESFLLFIINWGPMLYCNYVYAILMTIISIVLTIRHHENIGRLKAGNERQVHWFDRKKSVKD